MARPFLRFACALSIAFAVHATASAQDHAERYPTRIYGGLWLGFGGELESELTGPLGVRADSRDDLITTVGGQLGAEYVVMRYLALGGELRMGGLNTEAGDDADIHRSKLIDVDLKPRLRFAPRRLPLEVYATLPFGLTVPRLSDDLQDIGNFDERVGWNLGVGGGLSIFPVAHFGINVEPIWLLHRFKVDGPLGVDADVTVRQFALLLNLVLAL